MPRLEECASGTVRGSEFAAERDVRVKLLGEEYALGMEQKSNVAAVKDAQNMPSAEECA